jgi:y4mF family transcriptional regulator
MKQALPQFVKTQRKKAGLTQQDMADKAGVGIHFVRDLEQGRQNLQTGKVNQVLALFGHCLGPIPIER